MTQYASLRIIGLQLPQQVEQRAALCMRPRIGRNAVLIQSALVADADALVVPSGGMGAHLMHRTADVNLPVASDVEMIAYAGKSPLQMAAAESFHRKIAVATRGAAMNYQEAYLPIVLIETSCSHAYRPPQDVMPNTPASAVATVITTLRIIPHTDFDFFSIIDNDLLIIDNDLLMIYR